MVELIDWLREWLPLCAVIFAYIGGATQMTLPFPYSFLLIFPLLAFAGCVGGASRLG